MKEETSLERCSTTQLQSHAAHLITILSEGYKNLGERNVNNFKNILIERFQKQPRLVEKAMRRLELPTPENEQFVLRIANGALELTTFSLCSADWVGYLSKNPYFFATQQLAKDAASPSLGALTALSEGKRETSIFCVKALLLAHCSQLNIEKNMDEFQIEYAAKFIVDAYAQLKLSEVSFVLSNAIAKKLYARFDVSEIGEALNDYVEKYKNGNCETKAPQLSSNALLLAAPKAQTVSAEKAYSENPDLAASRERLSIALAEAPRHIKSCHRESISEGSLKANEMVVEYTRLYPKQYDTEGNLIQPKVSLIDFINSKAKA